MALRKVAVIGNTRVDITTATIEDERLCDFCSEILDPSDEFHLDGQSWQNGKPSQAVSLEIHMSCLSDLKYFFLQRYPSEPPF